MPYCTLDDYVDQFGEREAIRVTSDDPTATAPDAVAYGKASANADADVDAYLAGRYQLPLPTTPPLVKSIATALTREKLHVSFPTESVSRNADLARSQLRDLATGKATLIMADATLPDEPATASGIAYSAPDRVFSAAVLANY